MTFVCIGALTRDVSCLEEKEKRFCGTAGPPFWLNRNKILDVVLHASASSRASVQIGKRPSAAAYSRRAQLPSRRTLGGLSDRVRHRGNITVLRRTKEMFTPHGRVKSSDAFRVRRLNRRKLRSKAAVAKVYTHCKTTITSQFVISLHLCSDLGCWLIACYAVSFGCIGWI